jgi:hypothetical protein
MGISRVGGSGLLTSPDDDGVTVDVSKRLFDQQSCDRVRAPGTTLHVRALRNRQSEQQLLPPEGDDFQYRIKSAAEPHDRAVKERPARDQIRRTLRAAAKLLTRNRTTDIRPAQTIIRSACDLSLRRIGMNDARRKEIHRAVGLIDEAKGILETVLAGEQNDFENMPEDLQNDEIGQTAEDAADALERAAICCDDAISACAEATQD